MFVTRQNRNSPFNADRGALTFAMRQLGLAASLAAALLCNPSQGLAGSPLLRDATIESHDRLFFPHPALGLLEQDMKPDVVDFADAVLRQGRDTDAMPDEFRPMPASFTGDDDFFIPTVGDDGAAPAQIPEPLTLVLLGFGLFGAAAWTKGRKVSSTRSGRK